MADRPVPSIPVLAGLSEIADGYDGFILDLWGVLHDGHEAYPGAVAALRALRQRGRRIAILSNGPRRAAAVAQRSAELGIMPDLYDYLHSSGEETWRQLRDRRDPFLQSLGRRAFVLMPLRDRGLLDGLDLTLAEAPARADFLLVTGTDRREETVADYEAVLAAAAACDLPMICANPDLEVIHRGVREICAGALAQRYEALGGRVRYYGKPHASVYRACLAGLGIVEPHRLVVVGDSLRTDIAGAAGMGMDSVLVTGGIHAEELADAAGRHPDGAKLAAICARVGQRPTFALPAFVW
jgi:HAD superfamily hydrolase (TIGR01459 family)